MDRAQNITNTPRAPCLMTLSSGTATSKTAPPPPVSPFTPPAQRAASRFAVTGPAIVTGGAGGIGAVACRALLEHGVVKLAIFDVDAALAGSVVDTLRGEFPDSSIIFRHVDVADAARVDDAVAEVERSFGAIAILLACAGVTGSTHALDVTPDKWRRMLEINASGAFFCAQAVARCMIRQGKGGRIVFVASISGHVTNFPQGHVHYNASKAALLSVTRSLAAEWAVHGISVNSISPGYMGTGMNEGEHLEGLRREWVRRTPYGRMGLPEELTGAIVLLVSKAGSYITGTDIIVDGGLTVF